MHLAVGGRQSQKLERAILDDFACDCWISLQQAKLFPAALGHDNLWDALCNVMPVTSSLNSSDGVGDLADDRRCHSSNGQSTSYVSSHLWCKYRAKGLLFTPTFVNSIFRTLLIRRSFCSFGLLTTSGAIFFAYR